MTIIMKTLCLIYHNLI